VGNFASIILSQDIENGISSKSCGTINFRLVLPSIFEVIVLVPLTLCIALNLLVMNVDKGIPASLATETKNLMHLRLTLLVS